MHSVSEPYETTDFQGLYLEKLTCDVREPLKGSQQGATPEGSPSSASRVPQQRSYLSDAKAEPLSAATVSFEKA